jgi:hypothetical protein
MPSDIPFEEQEGSGAGFNDNHSAVAGLAGSAGSPPASTVRGRSRSTTRMDSMRGTVSGGSGKAKKRAVLFNLFAKVCMHCMLKPAGRGAILLLILSPTTNCIMLNQYVLELLLVCSSYSGM